MDIEDAEREIANILKRLEQETDCIVDSVSLDDIDVTNMDSERPTIERTVTIETHRLPGNSWGQADQPSSGDDGALS